MKKFIGYFDFLGYKEFILNNDSKHHLKRSEHILRNIEQALGNDSFIETSGRTVNNISNSKINCLNISDTVVFYTNDDSENDFEEFIKAVYKFTWTNILYNFPLRGAIVIDELFLIEGQFTSNNQGLYRINSVFGKGLVNSHIKAESQDWAGTVICEDVVVKAAGFRNGMRLINEIAKRYMVPYKSSFPNQHAEYVVKLISEDADKEVAKTICKYVQNIFEADNKPTDHTSVKTKLQNTINFIMSSVSNEI